MKHFKIVSALVLSVVVISAVTVLAVKYFDVLVRIFDSIKGQFTSKKPSFLGDACCNISEDQEESDPLAEI